MTEPSALAPEPFVPFPLWGLRQALADHQSLCGACRGVQPADCVNAWYVKLLNGKIATATDRRPGASTGSEQPAGAPPL